MATYKTREGDMLDAICVAHYKGVPLDQSTSAVLTANKGLAALGVIIPEDIVIELPEIIAIDVNPTIQLWN
jgi:phage tail protein X